MQKVKLILTMCLALLFSVSMQSQEGKELLDKFFVQYEAEGSNVALDSLFATNRWFAAKEDVVANVKAQLAGSVSLMGQYFGFELMEAKMASDCLVKYTYILKYERQPLRFVFTLYKSRDRWQMLNFVYSDSFNDDVFSTHLVIPK